MLYGAAGLVALAELAIFWLALHPNVNADYRAYFIDKTTTCLNTPIAGTYSLGDIVSFLPPGRKQALGVRVCGWEGPAGDGTHSIGESSRLRFTFPQKAVALELRVQLTGIPTPSNITQRVIFSANGATFGEVAIDARQTADFTMSVPPAAIGKEGHQLDLVLAYPDAIRPEPGDSNTRKRAIKLISVQLEKAPPAH